MATLIRSAWEQTIRGKPEQGAKARRSRRTSREDIERFSLMTGDYNPLHYNEELASNSVFGKVIVQGGVTSGLLNALVAEDLPGPGTVFLGVNWRFVRAVGVDEQITGEIEVTSVRDDKPICELATRIYNEDGQICLEGTATVYVAPLKPATSETQRDEAHQC
ncbi:MAG TPA: MaoC family dehydratase [Hyphomicrobium sp.]|nr:MaoC family dehydratase [Hyphomicrobium sp.]